MADPAPGHEEDREQPVNPERRRFLLWLWRIPVLAALAGVGYGIYEGARVIFGKEPAREDAEFEALEPVPVAALAGFDEVWASVPFSLGGLPAVAVRLPDPVAGSVSSGDVHVAAFSRICTHQECIVSLNRDLEAIAFAFNYRPEAPALTCPCHLSVFLPSQGGEAVSGPATEPLPRVRLRIEDGQVIAVGVESRALAGKGNGADPRGEGHRTLQGDAVGGPTTRSGRAVYPEADGEAASGG